VRADSHDLGNIAHELPAAVLRPESIEDIVKMVRFCRPCAIKVAMRGQAHTTFGQGFSPGVVIESRWLDRIHSIGPGGAVVDAGPLWRDLIGAASTQRLTPPAITGYTGLSIGGTLSGRRGQPVRQRHRRAGRPRARARAGHRHR
jgi:FAD/FMN-containing dehydrogenase